MSPSIEQLIEFNTQDVVKIIVDETGCDVATAMKRFYSSRTYDGLADPETGLYLQSPGYLYEVFLSEQDS